MAADPWNDRNYLMALLQRKPGDPLRQTAEKQWELLNQRETQAAQLGATRENLAETIRSREAGETEAGKQREERAKETAGYREDILSQRTEAAKNAEAARVLSALQYETDPKVTKQVLSQFYTQHGITPQAAAPDAAGEAARRARAASGQSVTPTPGINAPTAGLQRLNIGVPSPPGYPIGFGPAGADVNTGVVAGAPPATPAAPPTTAGAPPPSAAATGAPPTPAAPFQHGTQAYDYGPTVTAQPTFKEQLPGGLLRTHLPSGGTATAADPSTPEGLAQINEARKESSRLQGIPFSPATLAAKPVGVGTPAVATGKPVGPTPEGAPLGTPGAEPAKATSPGLNERLGAAGETLSKFTDPLGTAVKAAGAGIGNLGLGGVGKAAAYATPVIGPAMLAAKGIEAGVSGIGNLFGGGGGGANQIVQGGGAGPTPEPTPQGAPPAGPFSGIYTAGAPQPPAPTPAGTPPAVPAPGVTSPPPPAVSPELLRRRMVQQPQY